MRGRLSRLILLTTSGDPATHNRKDKPKDDKDEFVHLLFLPNFVKYIKSRRQLSTV